jgi:hypothetical protein
MSKYHLPSEQSKAITEFLDWVYDKYGIILMNSNDGVNWYHVPFEQLLGEWSSRKHAK